MTGITDKIFYKYFEDMSFMGKNIAHKVRVKAKHIEEQIKNNTLENESDLVYLCTCYQWLHLMLKKVAETFEQEFELPKGTLTDVMQDLAGSSLDALQNIYLESTEDLLKYTVEIESETINILSGTIICTSINKKELLNNLAVVKESVEKLEILADKSRNLTRISNIQDEIELLKMIQNEHKNYMPFNNSIEIKQCLEGMTKIISEMQKYPEEDKVKLIILVRKLVDYTQKIEDAYKNAGLIENKIADNTQDIKDLAEKIKYDNVLYSPECINFKRISNKEGKRGQMLYFADIFLEDEYGDTEAVFIYDLLEVYKYIKDVFGNIERT